jgi:hypothetical protein
MRDATSPTFHYYNSKKSAIGQVEATRRLCDPSHPARGHHFFFRQGDAISGLIAPTWRLARLEDGAGLTVPENRSLGRKAKMQTQTIVNLRRCAASTFSDFAALIRLIRAMIKV